MKSGFNVVELILPVTVLTLYGFGYVAADDPGVHGRGDDQPIHPDGDAQGVPYRHIIMRHALRNALIAPFTVIMLQINWLLSGVVVTEFASVTRGSARSCWRRRYAATSS